LLRHIDEQQKILKRLPIPFLFLERDTLVSTDTIDVLIRGARVVDGTGNPWFYGDVAIQGDRVLEIVPPGHIPVEAAREVIDATGMVVCPGFIDILSHSHIPLMHDPRDLSKITQGVTTEIMGEGWTPAPVGGGIKDPFLDLPPKERKLVGDWIPARVCERAGDGSPDCR
jgi:hypothetical protein